MARGVGPGQRGRDGVYWWAGAWQTESMMPPIFFIPAWRSSSKRRTSFVVAPRVTSRTTARLCGSDSNEGDWRATAVTMTSSSEA